MNISNKNKAYFLNLNASTYQSLGNFSFRLEIKSFEENPTFKAFKNLL